MAHIRQLVVRMATENRMWGYTRIQGALANLDHQVASGTIANILKRHGIEPAPERRFAVLFVIDLATRRVEIAGLVSEPDSAWVVQCGRHITDAVDGCLRGKRFLLHDRDPLFTDAFRATLAASGVQTVRLPPRSPNLNAYAERFVRTIKESCLDRLILVGEDSLRCAAREFVAHYHHERNHQDMDNHLLFPSTTPRRDTPIACRQRLGGLLRYYHRPAA